MATSESTPSPEKKPLPVSVDEFYKWDDLEEIHLCGLEDSSHTTGREMSHTLDFQQEKSPGLSIKPSSMEHSHHSKSLSSIEEPQEEPQEKPQKEPALMQQKGHKWFNWLKKRCEQYQVVSQPPPTGKSKSLSSSPQSHKSQPSPQSPGQKMASKFSLTYGTARSKGGEYSPSIINLATITDQVDVPQEVRTQKIIYMH